MQALTLAVATAAAVVISVPDVARAQGDCETMPVGPARTDCFMVRARIQGQKSDIAATKARQSTDAAVLGVTTGTSPKPKPRKGKPKRKASGQSVPARQ
jgi:hypothetical protein